MSYILDALKKSEREKTLGQVPTLESVVSDGAKKQSTGTPWWLNVIVFFVALLAVVAILKMAGLLEFSRSNGTASVQSAQPEVSTDNSNTTESDAQTVANASMSEPATGSATQTSTESQTSQDVAINQDDQSMVNEQQSEVLQTPPIETEDSLPLADTQMQDDLRLPGDESTQDQVQAAIDETPTANDTTAELEEKFAAQEAEEIAALAQELEAQQTNSNTNSATTGNTNEQPSQSNYEDVIHNDLRDVSVNVVSYSSDSRQRFVMLDLTIYKEGDQLPNNAKLIEVIRTGAIVEYQSKRYLLKP